MFNPLIQDAQDLTEAQLEVKLQELHRKFWQTSNSSVKDQIAAIIDTYKEELYTRREQQKLKDQDKDDDSGLDNLINVS